MRCESRKPSPDPRMNDDRCAPTAGRNLEMQRSQRRVIHTRKITGVDALCTWNILTMKHVKLDPRMIGEPLEGMHSIVRANPSGDRYTDHS